MKPTARLPLLSLFLFLLSFAADGDPQKFNLGKSKVNDLTKTAGTRRFYGAVEFNEAPVSGEIICESVDGKICFEGGATTVSDEKGAFDLKITRKPVTILITHPNKEFEDQTVNLAAGVRDVLYDGNMTPKPDELLVSIRILDRIGGDLTQDVKLLFWMNGKERVECRKDATFICPLALNHDNRNLYNAKGLEFVMVDRNAEEEDLKLDVVGKKEAIEKKTHEATSLAGFKFNPNARIFLRTFDMFGKALDIGYGLLQTDLKLKDVSLKCIYSTRSKEKDCQFGDPLYMARGQETLEQKITFSAIHPSGETRADILFKVSINKSGKKYKMQYSFRGEDDLLSDHNGNQRNAGKCPGGKTGQFCFGLKLKDFAPKYARIRIKVIGDLNLAENSKSANEEDQIVQIKILSGAGGKTFNRLKVAAVCPYSEEEKICDIPLTGFQRGYGPERMNIAYAVLKKQKSFIIDDDFIPVLGISHQLAENKENEFVIDIDNQRKDVRRYQLRGKICQGVENESLCNESNIISKTERLKIEIVTTKGNLTFFAYGAVNPYGEMFISDNVWKNFQSMIVTHLPTEFSTTFRKSEQAGGGAFLGNREIFIPYINLPGFPQSSLQISAVSKQTGKAVQDIGIYYSFNGREQAVITGKNGLVFIPVQCETGNSGRDIIIKANMPEKLLPTSAFAAQKDWNAGGRSITIRDKFQCQGKAVEKTIPIEINEGITVTGILKRNDSGVSGLPFNLSFQSQKFSGKSSGGGWVNAPLPAVKPAEILGLLVSLKQNDYRLTLLEKKAEKNLQPGDILDLGEIEVPEKIPLWSIIAKVIEKPNMDALDQNGSKVTLRGENRGVSRVKTVLFDSKGKTISESSSIADENYCETPGKGKGCPVIFRNIYIESAQFPKYFFTFEHADYNPKSGKISKYFAQNKKEFEYVIKDEGYEMILKNSFDLKLKPEITGTGWNSNNSDIRTIIAANLKIQLRTPGGVYNVSPNTTVSLAHSLRDAKNQQFKLLFTAGSGTEPLVSDLSEIRAEELFKKEQKVHIPLSLKQKNAGFTPLSYSINFPERRFVEEETAGDMPQQSESRVSQSGLSWPGDKITYSPETEEFSYSVPYVLELGPFSVAGVPIETKVKPQSTLIGCDDDFCYLLKKTAQDFSIRASFKEIKDRVPVELARNLVNAPELKLQIGANEVSRAKTTSRLDNAYTFGDDIFRIEIKPGPLTVLWEDFQLYKDSNFPLVMRAEIPEYSSTKFEGEYFKFDQEKDLITFYLSKGLSIDTVKEDMAATLAIKDNKWTFTVNGIQFEAIAETLIRDTDRCLMKSFYPELAGKSQDEVNRKWIEEYDKQSIAELFDVLGQAGITKIFGYSGIRFDDIPRSHCSGGGFDISAYEVGKTTEKMTLDYDAALIKAKQKPAKLIEPPEYYQKLFALVKKLIGEENATEDDFKKKKVSMWLDPWNMSWCAGLNEKYNDRFCPNYNFIYAKALSASPIDIKNKTMVEKYSWDQSPLNQHYGHRHHIHANSMISRKLMYEKPMCAGNVVGQINSTADPVKQQELKKQLCPGLKKMKKAADTCGVKLDKAWGKVVDIKAICGE